MTSADPIAAAKSAGLRYMTDDRPGIRRVKMRGGAFRFVAPDGKAIADEAEVRRIRALAIPPAYVDVWIAPDRNAHLQATGRDARGRKQYRYHARWREVRDENKFAHMLDFAKALPRIRASVAADLKAPGLSREKVLAAVVALLEMTMIRVGNEEYARLNDSFGLTTLLNEHARVRGATLKFAFRGKSGVEHEVTIADKRLAKIVRSCQDLPGHELFEYFNADGAAVGVTSSEVNAYIKTIGEGDFTAKDFRTWTATMECALRLADARAESIGERKALIVAAVAAVAEHLGNTPAVCRKSYIFPAILDEFLANGSLELRRNKAKKRSDSSLSDHERDVVAFIERINGRDESAHLKTLLKASVAQRKRDVTARASVHRKRLRPSSWRRSRARARRC